MFIRDAICISPQHSYDSRLFTSGAVEHQGNRYYAIEPEYDAVLPAGMRRRMSKIVRMGVFSGLSLLMAHRQVQAVIMATAQGGVDDSMHFLSQIEQFGEGTLTPTKFIQSTPNTLAGLLSEMAGIKGYNNTHVHEGLAFENAILDAKMYMDETQSAILLGAAEEISDWNFNINQAKGRYKTAITNSQTLLSSHTKGTVAGEGAAMFVLQADPAHARAHILDVDQVLTTNLDDVHELLLLDFLNRNNLKSNEIDAIMLGKSGDNRTGPAYDQIADTLFPKAAVLSFKNLSGEYPTASAFALWLASEIVSGRPAPEAIVLRRPASAIRNMLIYNQYEPDQHGIILISKV